MFPYQTPNTVRARNIAVPKHDARSLLGNITKAENNYEKLIQMETELHSSKRRDATSVRKR